MREEDFITIFSPGLNIDLKSRHTNIMAGVFPDVVFYHKNRDFNSVDPGTEFKMGMDFTERININIRNSFNKTKNPRLTAIEKILESSDIAGEIQTQQTERMQVFSRGDILYNFTPYAKANIVYSNNLIKYENINIIDYNHHHVGSGFVYMFPKRIEIKTDYRFNLFQFQDSRNTTVHSIVTGIKYAVSKNFYIEGSGGINLFSESDGSGFGAAFKRSIAINKKGKKTGFSLRYQNAISASGGFSGTREIQSTIISLVRDMSESFQIKFSGRYTANISVSGREDDFNTFMSESSVRYNVTPRLAFSISYLYTNQDSKKSMRNEFEKNQVLFNLELTMDKKRD